MDEEQSTREVQTTNERVGNTQVERQTVSERTATSGVVVAQRVVWYIVGFIVVLLAVRFALLLLGANDDNAFVSFIYSLSGFFAMPFYGIFSYEPAYGNSVFETSTAVAIAIYLLVGWGIAKLLSLGTKSGRTE